MLLKWMLVCFLTTLSPLGSLFVARDLYSFRLRVKVEGSGFLPFALLTPSFPLTILRVTNAHHDNNKIIKLFYYYY